MLTLPLRLPHALSRTCPPRQPVPLLVSLLLLVLLRHLVYVLRLRTLWCATPLPALALPQHTRVPLRLYPVQHNLTLHLSCHAPRDHARLLPLPAWPLSHLVNLHAARSSLLLRHAAKTTHVILTPPPHMRLRLRPLPTAPMHCPLPLHPLMLVRRVCVAPGLPLGLRVPLLPLQLLPPPSVAPTMMATHSLLPLPLHLLPLHLSPPLLPSHRTWHAPPLPLQVRVSIRTILITHPFPTLLYLPTSTIAPTPPSPPQLQPLPSHLTLATPPRGPHTPRRLRRPPPLAPIHVPHHHGLLPLAGPLGLRTTAMTVVWSRGRAGPVLKALERH